MYQIYLEKKVQKFLLKHQGQPIITQFKQALTQLALDPYQNTLDIKVLVGLPHCYRLRIGKWRFLYEILDQKLIISFLDAGPRGQVYKEV